MSSASKVNSFTRRAHSHLYFWRQRAIDAVVLEIPNEDRDGTNSTINIKKNCEEQEKNGNDRCILFKKQRSQLLQQVASQNTSLISAHVNGSLNQCRCQLLTDLSSQVNKTGKNFSDLTYVFLNVCS